LKPRPPTTRILGLAAGVVATVCVGYLVARFYPEGQDVSGDIPKEPPGIQISEVPGGALPHPALTKEAPAKLEFVVHPVDGKAGQPIGAVVQVHVKDRFGNLVATDDSEVRLEMSPPGAALEDAATKAENGVATFGNLSTRKARMGYTLTAVSGALRSDKSRTFTIAPAEPHKLAFQDKPNDATAGETLKPVRVTVEDIFHNPINCNVHVAIAPKQAGLAPSGHIAEAKMGIATFDKLSIEKAGAEYYLKASVGDRTVSSAIFKIVPAAVGHLTFKKHPSDGKAGEPIAPAVEVMVEDRFHNLVIINHKVHLEIVSKHSDIVPSEFIAEAKMGVATFGNVAIKKAGEGYYLKASVGNFFAPSTVFKIVPAAVAHLVFKTNPSDGKADKPIAPAVEVMVEDRFDNPVNCKVQLQIVDEHSGIALINGTATAKMGVATFKSLQITKAGTGYRLRARVGNRTADSKNAFEITPGPAAKLHFEVQPKDALVDKPNKATVSIQDIHGNLVRTSNTKVEVTLEIMPNKQKEKGFMPSANAVGGIATFEPAIPLAGNYTLRATAPGLEPSLVSNSFNVRK
jgi:hypothetical protein